MSTDNKYIREHSARLEDLFVTRRQFLQRTGMGLGMLGLAALAGEEFFGSTARAESIPTLAPVPRRSPPRPNTSSTSSPRALLRTLTPGTRNPPLPSTTASRFPAWRVVAMASPFKFSKKGKSGIEVSEVFPKLGEMWTTCRDTLDVHRHPGP